MSKKVALMCGHGKSTDGSWDPGTVYGGNNEAALMLPITKAAVKYLRSYGVSVISDADTNNDKNMIADVAWANKQKVDIYVSVHCDYYKAPTGVMPLYVSTNGKKLATALNNAVKSAMGMKSRGVIKRTDLYELNYTDAPACILETGSIKADISIFKNKADAYGKAIAQGICSYLGVKTTTATTATTTTTTATATALYRVRKTWADAKSQVGAYSNLESAKKVADEKGLTVFDANGKAVYTPTKTATTKEVYRVRKTWADAKSQVGAYTVLANAKKIADSKGLNVYDSKGTLVYTGKKTTTPTKAQQIATTALGYCGSKSKPTEAYKKAAKAAYGNDKALINCHKFVGVVLYKCGYAKMPIDTWANIFTYLRKNFTEIKVDFTESQLKAGDIRVHKNSSGGYHIWIITGSKQRAQANHNKKYYPHKATNNAATKHKGDWLFRAK